MNQQEIREYGGVTFGVQEGADLVEELNKRTEHSEDGYNSIAEVGTKLKTHLETNIFPRDIIDNAEPFNVESLDDIVSYLNTNGFLVEINKLNIFKLNVRRTVDGVSSIYTERYLFARNKTLGTWGNGSTNGSIVGNDLIPFNTPQLIISNEPNNAVYIDLGDIESNTIYDYINVLDVSVPEITWEDLLDSNAYFFKCIRNGVTETYKYEGVLPRSVGSGSGTTLIESDFDLIASGSIQGVVPTLQQITNAGAVTNVLSTFLSGLIVGDGIYGEIVFKQLTDFIAWTGGFLVQSAELDHYFYSGALEKIISEVFDYKGNYDASANTFSNNDQNKKGKVWKVTVPGVVDFGAGDIDLKVNDYLWNDGNVYDKLIDNNQGSGSGSQPPIDETYANITVLLADQNSQLEDFFYKVLDASDAPGVSHGAAVFSFNGTENGLITDYNLEWREFPLAAIKQSDETRVNDDTPSADTDLVLSLEANSIYFVILTIFQNSAGAPDFKSNFSIPNNATGYKFYDVDNSASQVFDIEDEITSLGFGVSTTRAFKLNAVIKTVDAGDLTLLWSQDTLSAENTTLKELSNMTALKLQ